MNNSSNYNVVVFLMHLIALVRQMSHHSRDTHDS